MKKVLLATLLINLVTEIYSFNPFNMMINKTNKWTTKINNVSNKEAYFAWLNNEWYNDNYNVIMEGDEYGKNSIRTKKILIRLLQKPNILIKLNIENTFYLFLNQIRARYNLKEKRIIVKLFGK